MTYRRKEKLFILLTIAMILLIVLGGCGKSIDPAFSTDASIGYDYESQTTGKQKHIAPSESFAGGDGTEENPYQISNVEELAYLAEMINGEYSPERAAYQQANYVLTADIVLNEYADGEDWSLAAPEYVWMPIGVKNPFRGTFDGNQHSVSGLYIHADVSTSDSYGEAYGLFGENQGTIKNLALTHSYLSITGYNAYLGGIAGRNSLGDARMENCTVEAVLACDDGSCGGLAGYNDGIVSGCIFLGSMRGSGENSDAKLGGIVGYNAGQISACKNEGGVTALNHSDTLGGIVGAHHGGTVTACTNAGEVSGGSRAGGIVGSMFLSDIGGDLKAFSCETSNCINAGIVRTQDDVAGGIVGEAMNDHSDFILLITLCKNEGDVQAAKKTGGIAGLVTISGAVSISKCENTADIHGGTVGGIAASVSYNYGSLTVLDCENTGNISASLYAAGILAENNLLGVYLGEKPSLDIAVTGCDNTGDITTDYCGGGILGTTVCPLGKAECEKITLTLENDNHHADITCNSFNAFTGGITGNLGIPYAASIITDCTADGLVRYTDIPANAETLKTGSARLEYARMSGGIVGRIGTGQYLSTTGDAKREEAVNAPDANIRFTHCRSSVRFDAPDESEYTYEIDGTPVYLNRFGGIIGYFSGEEGYTFKAEDCSYTNTARGLGNADLPDIGTNS